MKSKKGIIFALDGAIAISVVLIMLINTTYYFTTTSQESLSQSQVIKRGYDVVAMYDEAGRLDRAFRNVDYLDNYISEEGVDGLLVSDYLPEGYNMTILLHDAAKTQCLRGVGCEIPQAGFPYTEKIEIKPLVNGGALYVQANVDAISFTSGNPSLSLIHNAVPYPMTSVCDEGETCTYTTKERVPDFPKGVLDEKIRVGSDNTGDVFTVNWVKILDDPAYTLGTLREVPTDQFIGGGSRWFAAFDANGHFEGIHKASFKVWIEGDIPE